MVPENHSHGQVEGRAPSRWSRELTCGKSWSNYLSAVAGKVSVLELELELEPALALALASALTLALQPRREDRDMM